MCLTMTELVRRRFCQRHPFTFLRFTRQRLNGARFTDSGAQMPFSNEGFEPETIKLLDDCLDAAQFVASRYVSLSESVRVTLATALIEAWDRGLRDQDELVDFALRAIPAVRMRRG